MRNDYVMRFPFSHLAISVFLIMLSILIFLNMLGNSEFFLLLSAFFILIAYFLFYKFSSLFLDKISKFIFMIPATVFVITMVTPIVYGFVTSQLDEFSLEAGIELWQKGAFIHAVYFIFYAMGFFLANQSRLRNYAGYKILKVQLSKIYGVYLFIFLLMLYVVNLYLTPSGYGATQAETLGKWGDSSLYLTSFYSIPASFFLPTMIFLIFYVESRRTRAVLVSLALIYFGLSILTGTRASIIFPLFVIAFWAYFNGVRIKKIAFLCFTALVFISVIGGDIQDYRAQTIGVSNKQHVAETIINSLDVEFTFSRFKRNIEGFIYRIDVVQIGGLFAEYVVETGNIGLALYKGIIFQPIPRYFYPNKPLVNSIDGTPFGNPAFIAGNLRSGHWHNSSSLSVSSICYWEFGWIGVVISGLLSGALIRYLSVRLIKSGIIGQILFLHLCFTTYNLLTKPSSILNWLILYFVPIYFMLWAYSILSSHMRRHKHKIKLQNASV